MAIQLRRGRNNINIVCRAASDRREWTVVLIAYQTAGGVAERKSVGISGDLIA